MAQKSGWRRMLKRAAWLCGVGTVVVAVAAGYGYWQYVVTEPGEHLDREHIQGIIANESPVYYRDGTTRVGVFFGDEHRSYVPWEELPRPYIAAIVAAEDGGFWSHPGFSVKHIARAMRDNLAAGTLVAGGSTLTQQTAKNLFYRPDRSLRSKLVEGLNALRLEYHFGKPQILTFYANQFHVSGNGRGLGIAARHFFNKPVQDLTVLECAFLAGLVKGPSNYDPFLGDSARQARAATRAHDRTAYVLRRLVDEPAENLAGPYSQGDPASAAAYAQQLEQVASTKAEAARLLAEGFELPFERGVFRYDASVVLDEVARRLAEPPFDAVLEAAGIDDPSTAGLRVVTSLDVDAQREAIYALWHHLTEVGWMMEAPALDALVRSDSRGPRHEPDQVAAPHTFRLATVVGPAEVDGKKVLDVDLGGVPCRVDRDGLVRVAVHLARGQAKSPYTKVQTPEVDAVADGLPVDAVVWVSVREAATDDRPAICDVEWRPELQGAAVVLDKGAVRAMVGGNDNRNFNRVDAPRQMGSTWKPLVFHAAMELGWRPDDLLDNRRGVFPFSTTFYYPRPDHTPEDEVSMAWAGVRSENLASIWLLYHLTDRMSAEERAALAAELGLTRGEDESADDYALRVQKLGVLPTPSRRKEARFLQARQEALEAIDQLAHPEDAVSLASLHYGWGFAAERRRVAGDARKLSALDHSWVTVGPLRAQCHAQVDALERGLKAGELPSLDEVPDLMVRLTEPVEGTSADLRPKDRAREVLEVSCGRAPDGFVRPSAAVFAGGMEEETPGETTDGAVEQAEVPDLRPRQKRRQAPRVVRDDVIVNGRLHLATLDVLESAVERLELAAELQAPEDQDLYAPNTLYNHQDFRVLLSLRYLTRLAAQLGVRTELQEVLSLPLGASEITLEESTLLYQGITTGAVWRHVGRGPGGMEVSEPAAPTLLIEELRDPDGTLLYRSVPVRDRTAPDEVAAMTTDILTNVVRFGTGARARDAVKLGAAALPLGGKTGTTNSFRNAAFMGWVPRLMPEGVRYGEGLTVGSYVGYDDNRKMISGRISVQGANGALPVWRQIAVGMAEAGLLGDPTTALPPEESVWPLPTPPGLVRRPVGPKGAFLDLDGLPDVDALLNAGSVLTRPAKAPSTVRATDLLQGRPARIAPRRGPRSVNPEGSDGRDAPRGIWDLFKRRRSADQPD